METTAVFLDRDGVINEVIRGHWIDTVADFKLYPFTIKAIKLLNDLGIPVFIITNQSGIARNTLKRSEHFGIISKMFAEFEREGVKIEWIYTCPHPKDPTICDCRKPKPGLIYRAIKDFRLPSGKKWFIGDYASDIETGFNAGVTPIMVRTGLWNEGELEESIETARKHKKNLVVLDNLYEACKWIRDASLCKPSHVE